MSPNVFAAAMLAVIVPTAWASHVAPAQELASMPLDRLLDMPVSGASKFSSTMGETAAAVTLVTSDEIRALGFRTLAEVLATVKGITLSNDRGYTYLGVRGFYVPGDLTTRVLLLVDGNRVNDALYDQAYVGDEFPVDLDMVERVEFIPGQGSAVYGANALFGVINVVLKQPSARQSGAVRATVGSFGEKELRASMRHLWGESAHLLWSVSAGLREGPNVRINGSVVPNGDAVRRNSAMLDARLDDVRLNLVHSSRWKAAATVIGTDSAYVVPAYEDEQTLFNATWTPKLAEGYEATVRAFGGAYHYFGRYAFEGTAKTVNVDNSYARWWGLEARLTTMRIAGNKLMLGAELQSTPLLRQRNEDLAPNVQLYTDVRHRARRASIFLEDQYQLTKQLTLDVGLRHDKMSGFADQGSSRTALIWRPLDSVVAKAIAGRAYRTPNRYESDYVVEGPGGYVRNPNLGVESVRGSELSLEWAASASDSLSASLYRGKARDLVALQYEESRDRYMHNNQGEVEVRGWEAEWRHTWHNGARMRANVSRSVASDTMTAIPVAAYAPGWTTNVLLTAPTANDINIGVNLHGASRRGESPGYGTMSITLSNMASQQGWNWAASAYNLFDRRYSDPGADLEVQPTIEQAGRSVRLTVERAF